MFLFFFGLLFLCVYRFQNKISTLVLIKFLKEQNKTTLYKMFTSCHFFYLFCLCRYIYSYLNFTQLKLPLFVTNSCTYVQFLCLLGICTRLTTSIYSLCSQLHFTSPLDWSSIDQMNRDLVGNDQQFNKEEKENSPAKWKLLAYYASLPKNLHCRVESIFVCKEINLH